MKLKQMLLEITNNIIAYHGSAEKFDKFSRKPSVSGNSDADIGYWFTIDSNLAKRFATAYPSEYYDKLTSRYDQYDFINDNKEKIWNIIKDFSINEFDMEYYEYTNPADFVYTIKKFIKNDEYNKLVTSDKTFLDTIVNYNNNDADFKSNLEKYYTENHKGTLYTCKLRLGKHAVLNGEDVGVGNNRTSEILSLQDKGYDSVKIINGDTGQGIGTEIIIFDVNNIDIIKTQPI